MKKQTKIQIGGTIFGAALGAGVITYLLLQPSARDAGPWNVTRGVLVALTILMFAGMGWGISWCSRPSPWVRKAMIVGAAELQPGDHVTDYADGGKFAITREVPR